MSNKRTRLGSTTDSQSLGKELTQNVELNHVNTTLEKQGQEYYDEEGSFMWEAYMASCPSAIRKPNPHIKTKNGDRVYSRESYAQELYDTLQDFQINNSVKSKVNTGEIHAGIIYAITQDTISVDIGYRELVYVKASKEPEEFRNIPVGEETSVLITNTDNAHIDGSISGGVKQKMFMDLRASVDVGDTAWVGKVTDMIENGGYIVNVQGVECFMPGSLAGINKLADFNSIIGEELYVVPVSFSTTRGTIVVSHRKYLQALIPHEISKIEENAGEELVGNVTGTAKYGIFVEFNNCLTGMIHKNDLDAETFELFKNRKINPGDEIKFKVKEVVSNSKITLTQKTNIEINPWHDINSRYNIPSVVTARVKAKKDYGLFVSIEEGIAGLLHVSELGENVMDVFNPGDEITVKITRIEEESQRVFLKLP
jgi:small subunit ribosomal protein S1